MGMRSFISKLFKPSKMSLGAVLLIGFLAGVVFWGGFNASLELTNTEAFCVSCHEMEVNTYAEYQATNHYSNRSGVRATCPDCHVPKPWGHKLVRKIKSTKDVYHKLMGTIDTPEKYEQRRLEMAEKVWDSMKKTDSRECRNCHEYQFMNYEKQDMVAMALHMEGFEAGKTCIDCHKGVAHKLPEGYEVEIDLGE